MNRNEQHRQAAFEKMTNAVRALLEDAIEPDLTSCRKAVRARVADRQLREANDAINEWNDFGGEWVMKVYDVR